MNDCFGPGTVRLLAEFEGDSSSACSPARSCSEDIPIFVQHWPTNRQLSVTYKRPKAVQDSLAPHAIRMSGELENSTLIVCAATGCNSVEIPLFVECEGA